MIDLTVQNVGTDRNAKLVVDSRLIAQVLGVRHISFMETLRKYQAEIEEDFGLIHFDVEKLGQSGSPTIYALLVEDQAMCLMTYSRNTDRVRATKRGLVKAFSEAKALTNAILDPLIRSLLQSLTFSSYETQGYVYALVDIANDRIKIGVTKDLEQRLKALQSGDSHTLLFNGVRSFETMKEAMAGEREIHETLKTWRYSGEWFRGAVSEVSSYSDFFHSSSRPFSIGKGAS